jgi:hypothetical protein
MIRKSPLFPAACIGLVAFPLVAAEVPLTFNRDVRPILAEACFHCHGPDSVTRKADLRLDTEAGFFGKDGGAEAAVIPGKPQESSLYDRLITDNPDDIMPPPDSHKELKPEQIEIVRRWIAEGAKWQPHWSFVKPEKPAEPEVSKADWTANPIDRFILAGLDKAGLTPAPEADRRALARRVALDLTGLPPTPEEVEAFVADLDPKAYEKLIDRYLASPRWGEHRGRYWLDAARYADTHGLHFDNYREMWLYRDWVIGAFNQNQRFDQFTIEQVAGDLLPKPTESQLIATGFQRCNMTTNEGGTIDEENIALYASDRVQTMGWVYLGLTLNCSQCHDHKFDPLSQGDYYSMAAFFRNTTQGPKDGNVKDSGPILVVPAETDRPRWDALPGEIATASGKRNERRGAARPAFDQWLASATPAMLEEGSIAEKLTAHFPLNEGKGGALAARLPADRKGTAPESIAWAAGGKFGSAPVIKKDTTADLGDLANFARNEPFSVAAWVRPAKDGVSGSVVARMDVAGGHRGWDLLVEGRNVAFHLIDTWPDNAIKAGTQRPALNPGQWSHVVATYDGSGKAAGVIFYVNGKEAPSRVLSDKLKADAETRNNTPLRLGQRSAGMVFEEGQVQDLRIFAKRLSATEAEPSRPAAPSRTSRRRKWTLKRPWRTSSCAVPMTKSASRSMRRLRRRCSTTPGSGAPANRLGLAQWLVDAGRIRSPRGSP